MHPFLVWLLCAGGGSPASTALSLFAQKQRVFTDIPKENLEQMLNLVMGWQPFYEREFPGRKISQDTAAAWCEYSTWLGEVAARRVSA